MNIQSFLLKSLDRESPEHAKFSTEMFACPAGVCSLGPPWCVDHVGIHTKFACPAPVAKSNRTRSVRLPLDGPSVIKQIF